MPASQRMVLTVENRNEVAEMVQLGKALGSGAVRFGHLMSTPETALRGLDISTAEHMNDNA
jgi:hypothetical protein